MDDHYKTKEELIEELEALRAEVASLRAERSPIPSPTEQQQYTILEHLPVGVLLTTGTEQKIIYQNPSFIKLFGYTLADCPTVEQWWPLAYPNPKYREWVSTEWNRRIATAMEQQTTIEPMEVNITAKDGSVKYIRVYGSVIGELNLITFVDLSEQQQAYTALQESEMRFRSIFDSSVVGMICADFQGRITDANDHFLEMVGYTREELEAGLVRWDKMTPPEYVPTDLIIAEHLKQHSFVEPWEKEYYRKDGSRVAVLIGIALLPESTEQCLCVVVDITELKQKETALREREERFRTLADNAPVLIWRSGQDKLCKYFNKPWLDFTGHLMEQELGNGWAEGVYADDFQHCLDTYINAFDARERFTMEYRLRRFDGEYRWILDTGVPLLAPNGEFMGYIGSCIDITDRKEAEKTIRELESQKLRNELNLLENILEEVLAGYWDWDLANNQEYLSPGFKRMFGYEEEELPNSTETWQNLIFPEDLPGVMECFDLHVQSHGEIPYYNEVRYRHKDGSTIWVICSGKVIEWDEQGNPLRMIGCHIDITQRKLTETQLQLSQERLELALEGSGDGLWDWNIITNEAYLSPRYLEMLGYEVGELLPNVSMWEGLIHPDDKPKVMAIFQAHLQDSSIPYHFDYRLRQRSGEYKWIANYGKVVERDAAGQPVRMVGLHRDINERKLAEEKLRQSEANLAEAQRIAKIGGWHFNVDTGKVTWSEETFRIFARDTQIGEPTFEELQQLIHCEDREKHQTVVQNSIQTGQPFETDFRFFRSDGSLGWMWSKGETETNSLGQVCVLKGIVMDITERKLAEQELRNLSQRLKLAIDSARMGIWEWDVTKDYLICDERMLELYGITDSDSLVSYTDWEQCLLSEDREKATTAVAQALKGENDYDCEFRILFPNGIIRTLKGNGIVQRNAQGEPLSMIGVNYDISEIKQAKAQLELLNAELEQRIADRTEELNIINYRLQQELDQSQRLQQELFQQEQLLKGFFNAASASNIGLSIHGQDLSYLEINQTLADINGFSIEEHLGKKCTEITPEVADSLIPILQRVVDTGEAVSNLEISAFIASNFESPRYFLVSFFPIFGYPPHPPLIRGKKEGESFIRGEKEGESETVIAVGEIVLEITERKMIEAALRQSEEQRRLALDLSNTGLWDFDLLTGKTIWNDNMFHLLGLVPDEVEPSYKMWLECLHPDDRERIEKLYVHSLETKTDYEAEYQVLYPDGSVHWLMSRGKALYNEFGQPLRSLGVALDITEKQAALRKRQEAEEALKHSEEKYRQIVETATEGIWILDSNANTSFANPRIAAMLGYSVEEMIGQSLLAFMDEEWQKIAISKLENRRQGISEQHEFKFRRKDGADLWCMVSTSPLFDEAGHFTGALGMIADISERKLAEQALQKLNQVLEERVSELKDRNAEMLLLNGISDYLQSCLTVKEACASITTLSRPLFPECSGGIFILSNSRNYLEVVTSWGNDLASQVLFSLQDCWALRRGRPHRVTIEQQDLLCNHTQAEYPPTETLCIPLTAQGEILGLLYVCASKPELLTEPRQQLARTIAEQLSLAIANITLREKLQNQSIRDPLTSLFNRRYLEEFLTKEVARAQRNQYQIGIIMLDIDHFKNFNDTLGHDAGDFVLTEIGHLLKNSVRVSDLACRYGGEEMTLILPEATLEETHHKAEEIREGIAKLKLNYNDKILGKVTASFGVACYPNHGITGNAVIQAADRALYEAKAAGRNRVVIADTSPPNPLS